ncbi:MAG: tannase/feruloyl esterase family alpha/beta hydrolase, partial [Gemmatimonadetes bacterium]|nr:tannase/feruloyl esterase family alpha/beta hydrolase [Gemmatimonadota bacterium]
MQTRFRMLVLLSLCVAGRASGAQSTLPPVTPKVACASLRGFDPKLAEAPTQIGDARETQVEGKPTCVVRGYVSPQVQFEVRLPMQGWTQRYLQTGCGGLCGTLSVRVQQRPCPIVQRGELVTASTDMGHQGPGGTWAALDPRLRVDFAYRGVHVTALVAKALIEQFYGQPPRWSYFSGCSDGGREGMMEAQRYPDDFDGIAAGAPAFNFLVQNSFYHAWNARSVVPDSTTPVLLARDLAILHAAALAACDSTDGLTDGLVANPTGCHFDPTTVACRDGAPDNCLTPAAVAAATAIYSGARSSTGQRLVIGGPQPGSELSWAGVFVPQTAESPIFSATIASDVLRSIAYWRPLPASWTLSQFRFEASTLAGLMPMHGLYDATDPNLSAFARRRGKLLIWHGWSDPHISPLNSIAYAQAVTDRLGPATRDVLRLFLIPGMYHCG